MWSNMQIQLGKYREQNDATYTGMQEAEYLNLSKRQITGFHFKMTSLHFSSYS